MTALAIAAIGLALVATGGLITMAVWYRGANEQIGNLRDTMTANDAVSDAYQYERDNAVAELAQSKEKLAKAETLRAIAEAQRNDAQGRLRVVLREHMEDASDDEIRELVSSVFASALSVVPHVPDVPQARRSESGPDALIDPGL